MLSRTTLRTKLVLLALVPLVAVAGVASRSVRTDFSQADAAAAQAAEVDRASKVYDIGRALERELLVDRIVAPSAGEEPTLVSPRGLDQALGAFLDDPASADESAIATVEAFDQRLPALRAALAADAADVFDALVAARDALALDPLAAATMPETPDLETAALEWTAFTRFVDGQQDFDTSIFIDSATTEDALTLEMTASLREAVALQGASFSSLLTSDEVDAELLGAATQASAAATRAQQDLVQFGSADFVQLVQANGGAELTERIAGAADEVLAQEIGAAPSVDVQVVRPAYLAADQLLIGAVDVLFGELTDVVTQVENDARSSAVTTVVLLAVMSIGLMVLVFLLYRSIRGPLRRVTERSRDVANVQLPGVVASMRADVDAELPEVEAIAVSSNDEIGELVTAFNMMSATAVGLVGEQAAARRSIADMFMNLGRRNQKLLNRLLRNLDRLERDEEDPDVLQTLYDIDHITTRMRRNAESLLVLAGAEQSRSFTRPASAGDVVRAALAEVESYQRVVVSGDGSQLLTGECVADVAHLLAELVENALAFSPPETMVQVNTRMTPHGYIIAITDDGVGMAADKLAESNQRIAAAAGKEETPSKFLGLFVVGRLAARRGIEVELFDSPSGGVTARVTLPAPTLHVDRTDLQAPAPAAPPAPAAIPEPPAPAPATTPAPVAAAAYLPPAAAPVASLPEAVPLLVPPTPTRASFAAPIEAVSALSSSAPPPSRPNRFGAPGRRPGAHLPRTVVLNPDAAMIAESSEPLQGDERDAATVQRSLASFQAGTAQADRQSEQTHHETVQIGPKS
jgi:signal transduction histidine kinase